MAERLLIDVNEFGDKLGAEVDNLLVEFGNQLVNNLKRESPVGATGDLQRSWQIFLTGRGRVVLGSRIGYADDVNDGTEPHEPDFQQIKIWARRVLGDESAAGPVWRKIKEEGTEPNPYIDRSLEKTINEFQP